MVSTGRWASSGSLAPPIRTSRPRPRPRRGWSGAVDKLHRHLPVRVGAGRASVVSGYREAVTGGFGDPYRARNARLEDEFAEMPAHFGVHVGSEPRSPVAHRQDDAGDRPY